MVLLFIFFLLERCVDWWYLRFLIFDISDVVITFHPLAFLFLPVKLFYFAVSGLCLRLCIAIWRNRWIIWSFCSFFVCSCFLAVRVSCMLFRECFFKILAFLFVISTCNSGFLSIKTPFGTVCQNRQGVFVRIRFAITQFCSWRRLPKAKAMFLSWGRSY